MTVEVGNISKREHQKAQLKHRRKIDKLDSIKIKRLSSSKALLETWKEENSN